MRRTATTEQVAAALNVKPATVRKYAREHRLPYDTTP
ncbi:MAG: helix-turn-helix domain-containing protein, partial [Nitriliruptoraceae bacterium]